MKRFLCFALIFAGAAAVGHEGVKNPAVMARMNGMSAIASELKVIGEMAKGVTAFDAVQARAAAVAIAGHAAETPELFAAPESDPKSEALPAIWENFDDFTEKALELEAIAGDLSQTLNAREDLRPALQSLGENCSSCHKAYRE
ncbi:MAG: cytochrome c [Pseudomonadota bacterium]